MVLHNIKLPVCGIYVDKFNIIEYIGDLNKC